MLAATRLRSRPRAGARKNPDQCLRNGSRDRSALPHDQTFPERLRDHGTPQFPQASSTTAVRPEPDFLQVTALRLRTSSEFFSPQTARTTIKTPTGTTCIKSRLIERATCCW